MLTYSTCRKLICVAADLPSANKYLGLHRGIHSSHHYLCGICIATDNGICFWDDKRIDFVNTHVLHVNV